MTQGCGNCNYRGKIIEPTREGIKISCLCDGRWHSDTFRCNRWTPFLDNITSDARVKMAMDLRNSEKAQKNHQETMGTKREENAIARWTLRVSILGLIISMLIIALKQMGVMK